MPTFTFNGPTNTAGAAINFSSGGVNFTASTTGGGVATHGSSASQLTFSGGGNFTLDVNTTAASTNFSGTIALQAGTSVSGNWQIFGIPTVATAAPVLIGTLNSTNSMTSLPLNTVEFSSIRFVSPGASNFMTLNSLTATIVCYCAGTAIATPEGETLVEDLKPGDVILTADGGKTTVKWLGLQPVDTRLTHPATVNPIRIAAGALAEGVPARDLFVSPDHAIEIDGLLYQASTLVNGRTITMVARMPEEGFTYYHVETEAHELILAEGCPAESYVDVTDRSSFVNAGDRAGAAPIAEMDLPRISARRLVPESLRTRIEARADALETARRDAILDGARAA